MLNKSVVKGAPVFSSDEEEEDIKDNRILNKGTSTEKKISTKRGLQQLGERQLGERQSGEQQLGERQLGDYDNWVNATIG
uniref:Uncharacterized protein n=1 Tax=Romanomermis culicivorax TaxID=13658 RepID=A0A915IBF9_ROMCU